MIDQGDIVKFASTVPCLAGKWCHDKGISGVVCGTENNMHVVANALRYPIYAHATHLIKIASSSEVPIPGQE